ncbi:MAG: hypothetical protein K8I60_20950, partial [Anaerolineae bacterium]|nr:hypothetical protein [Anaerolineae bacterium]
MDTLSAATLARQILARLTAFLKQQQDTNGPHDARDEQLYYRTRGQLIQFPGGRETLARLVEFPSDAGLQQGTRVFLERAIVADARFAEVMTGLLEPPPPPDLPEMPGSSPGTSQLVPGGNTSIGGSGNVQQTVGTMSSGIVIGQQININQANERELSPLDSCPLCNAKRLGTTSFCVEGHVCLPSRMEHLLPLPLADYDEFNPSLTDANNRHSLLLYVKALQSRIYKDSRVLEEDLLGIGLVYLWLHEYDIAQPCLEQCIRHYSTNAYGWYAFGLAKLRDRRPRLLLRAEADTVLTYALRAIQRDEGLVGA